MTRRLMISAPAKATRPPRAAKARASAMATEMSMPPTCAPPTIFALPLLAAVSHSPQKRWRCRRRLSPIEA